MTKATGPDAEASALHVIARIYTEFPTKFGIPRQSNLADALQAVIVFEPDYRNADALRGIEEYSHIWLIWGFCANKEAEWSPTVRPPRLGGNKRIGVFATRSPYRPNAMGLSSVRLVSVEERQDAGTVLVVAGADLMNGTPIYDIKPYLAYTDSHPDAKMGFAGEVKGYELAVVMSGELADRLPDNKRKALIQILSQDPRPSYHDDPERIYGFFFGDFEITFTVQDAVLNVKDIRKI